MEMDRNRCFSDSGPVYRKWAYMECLYEEGVSAAFSGVASSSLAVGSYA